MYTDLCVDKHLVNPLDDVFDKTNCAISSLKASIMEALIAGDLAEKKNRNY